ncbi:asparagine--tRNA ligase [Calorimonas adulescens]|uniref:Asparagine--tRNA ligase n=1 Tax=Calorimonas adulescens TaxID=2606906 RepID=A0A5D8QB95_9THEO|nr:asparagine--tRNA ligase [Calorimonas adulescens]TZE80793.1 asparagine--tRNA ligase [Calorimonas adulescens]
MIKCSISDVKQYEGQEVLIKGWLYNKRSSGKIQFLQLRDGSGFIQAIVEKSRVSPELFELCEHLTQESSINVVGRVRSDKRAPSGYEMDVIDVVVNQLTEDYPIALKEHGVEFLMDNRHLWIRTERQSAILRIRHEIIKSAMEFLNNHGFIKADAPIITPATCEGTTDLFEIDYFGESAYLSQTGQLYAEACAMALGKVYTLGPAFRAEKSKTRRHLIEFWMLEPEVAYLEHEGNLELQEKLVSYIVESVLKNRILELKAIGRDISALEEIKIPFERMSYDDAIKTLKNNNFDIEWGDDFGSPEETFLANLYKKPLFITEYPKHCKAFYMQPNPNRPEVVLCDDLLAPEGYGEIIGGSQRIHDYDLMVQRLEEENLPMDIYKWYLDLRKYGSVPHSGFGLGIERTVAWICGLDHIRETIPFPRMLYRVTP